MLKLKKTKATETDYLKDRAGCEIFNIQNNGSYGFIQKPRCIAYDEYLKIIAIGTSKGTIKIIGATGVEFSVDHETVGSVQQILFMKGRNAFISVFETNGLNSLYIWQFVSDSSVKVSSIRKFMLDRIKNISFCCISNDLTFIYIGNDHGNVYKFNLKSFILEENIIYHDLIYQCLPFRNDNNCKDLGSVEIISSIDLCSDKILIGYRCGLVVIWNINKTRVDYCLDYNQQLEYVYWNRMTSQIVSSYSSGILCHWTLENSLSPSNLTKIVNVNETKTNRLKLHNQPTKVTPYKSDHCKPITKIEWHQSFFIFVGGIPIENSSETHAYDNNTLSIMQGSIIIATIEFGSNIIDFITINENDYPNYIFILTEQELSCIDVSLINSPLFKPNQIKTLYPESCPCIHSSSITTFSLINSCPSDVCQYLFDISKQYITKNFSTKSWPLYGGRIIDRQNTIGSNRISLLLTGHEDGSIVFWNMKESSMKLLFKISTSDFYNESCGDVEMNNGRIKLGLFDPFMDDIRFSIQKIHFCVHTKKLFVAGCVGNLMVFDLITNEPPKPNDPFKEIKIELIQKSTSFVWKGHDPLTFSPSLSIEKLAPPFRISTIYIVHPPAPFTAMSFDYTWGLLAFGTCHGFGLIDLVCRKTILTMVTYDITKSNEVGATIQRKSFARSLRESFRKLRVKKPIKDKTSQNNTLKTNLVTEDSTTSNKNTTNPRFNRYTGSSRRKLTQSTEQSEAFKRPAVSNRLVTENRVDDTLIGTIRCLSLINSSIEEGIARSPCLWAGSNSGIIYICMLSLPNPDRRWNGEAVKVNQCREIRLKHKAPVISVIGVDRVGAPLPSNYSPIFNWSKNKTFNDASSVDQQKNNQTSLNHHIIICSEEQLRVIQMPGIKLKIKEKLTAIDGSRIRKAIHIPMKIDQDYSTYNYLILTTNYGYVSVYHPITLKLLKKERILDKDDILALQSVYLSESGCGFFLKSSALIQRFSILFSQNYQNKVEFTFPNGNIFEKSDISNNDYHYIQNNGLISKYNK